MLDARVERVEHLVAKGDIRVTLAPGGDLPRLRLSLPIEDAPAGLGPGARIKVKARVQPPPAMALPGGHDFARDAWFEQRGGAGRAIGPVAIIEPGTGGGLDGVRDRLGAHIRDRLPGASGGVAVALANGDQAGVGEADADAMRRSGLTHLLSVSGLHIAAAVAEYQKLVDANPADTEAAAGLAMAQLLQRTEGVDLAQARAAAAERPDDVDAQTMVADLDLLGGHVDDAFHRLVELVRRTSEADRDAARTHLIGLFGAVGNDDPRVQRARRDLASALF
jgi:hypothetical protein